MEEQNTPVQITKEFLRNQNLGDISLGSGHVLLITNENNKLCPFEPEVFDEIQKSKRKIRKILKPKKVS